MTDPAIEAPKREYDQDGYYVVPKSDVYPGMIARKLPSGREFVCFGDPASGREAIDQRVAEMQLSHPIG